jgi:hypothetical protein
MGLPVAAGLSMTAGGAVTVLLLVGLLVLLLAVRSALLRVGTGEDPRR